MQTPEFTPVDRLTYAQAVNELDAILRSMQNDSCDIDQLTVYTRRAAELMAECRKRLTATDRELQAILAEMEQQ